MLSCGVKYALESIKWANTEKSTHSSHYAFFPEAFEVLDAGTLKSWKC